MAIDRRNTLVRRGGNRRPASASAPRAVPPEICRAYVYVASRDGVFDMVRRRFLDLGAVARLHLPPGETVSGFKEMLLCPEVGIRKVAATTYLPGTADEVVEVDGAAHLNLWRRPRIRPVNGDADRFLEFLSYVLDGDWGAIAHVLDFAANLVQRPEVKIMSALLICGPQGVGKSTIGRVIARAVGEENTQSISMQDLMGAFNAYIESTSLLVIEELAHEPSRAVVAKLKSIITDTSIYVNAKNRQPQRTPNLANLIAFSNDTDAAVIDGDDRRWFVWHSRARPRPPAYYADLNHWLEDGGYGKVLRFLLDRDISGFNPHAAPPGTEAHAEMARESLPRNGTYLTDAIAVREAPFNKDVVSINEIIDTIVTPARLNMDAKAVGRYLRAAGAIELGEKRLPSLDGRPARKQRLWAVRNQEHWVNASEREIGANYCAREATAPAARARAIGGIEDVLDSRF